MREIVLDTETTGLDPAAGHRIVEIACVELDQHLPTGRVYQTYLNPERDVPAEAERIHGLKTSFLSDQPLFKDQADSFLSFLADSPLVIHNAEFDLKFINAELALVSRPPIVAQQAIDTVMLAREKLPGAQVSLDALCRRFNIDLTQRSFHGALLDCQLLAAVYLELRGGRQQVLGLAGVQAANEGEANLITSDFGQRKPVHHALSADEQRRHVAMLERLTDPIWKKG